MSGSDAHQAGAFFVVYIGAVPEEPNQSLSTTDITFFGAVLAGAVCLGLAILGLWLLFSSDTSRPLCVALIIAGFANTLLAFQTIRGSRIAWSFLLSSSITLAIIFLFGAPKLRDATGHALATSAVPFLVFLIASTLLAFRGSELGKNE